VGDRAAQRGEVEGLGRGCGGDGSQRDVIASVANGMCSLPVCEVGMDLVGQHDEIELLGDGGKQHQLVAAEDATVGLCGLTRSINRHPAARSRAASPRCRSSIRPRHIALASARAGARSARYWPGRWIVGNMQRDPVAGPGRMFDYDLEYLDEVGDTRVRPGSGASRSAWPSDPGKRSRPDLRHARTDSRSLRARTLDDSFPDRVGDTEVHVGDPGADRVRGERTPLDTHPERRR